MKHLTRNLAICFAFALSFATCAMAADSTKPVIDVYKSPSCHCCVDWMKHIEHNGFATRVHHPKDLDALKTEHGVPDDYTSCHTGVSKEGYVFEGHVPAKFMHRFLANPPPGAHGLSVPGMPLGSPGMESDDFFMPYKIWLLKDDGSVEVWVSITTAAEQFDL